MDGWYLLLKFSWQDYLKSASFYDAFQRVPQTCRSSWSLACEQAHSFGYRGQWWGSRNRELARRMGRGKPDERGFHKNQEITALWIGCKPYSAIYSARIFFCSASLQNCSFQSPSLVSKIFIISLMCVWRVWQGFPIVRNSFKFLKHFESETNQFEIIFKLLERFSTQFRVKESFKLLFAI